METFSKPFACIFDMDGVLVDNREYHKQAWAQFIDTYCTNKQFDYEELMVKFFGKTNQKIFEYLFDKTMDGNELEMWEDRKEVIYRTNINTKIVPVGGLIEFLHSLKNAHVPTGIGTSGPMKNVLFVLDKFVAHQFFTAITDGNQVEHGKPDPEVFLLTAKKLGVEPRRCIVFEDSISGVQAGLNAGMTVVGIATEHSIERLISVGATIAVKDFTKINIEDVYSLLK